MPIVAYDGQEDDLSDILEISSDDGSEVDLLPHT